MDLFPAIDLRAGRAVRLRQGDYARETVYGDDPVAIARSFAAAGARWVHVVDLDAARDGGAANLAVVEAICAAIPECRVQTGGGVRDRAGVVARLAAGAARVVVGSAAVDDPGFVADVAARHPGAVAVGLDVRDRDVATHGWTRRTGRDVLAVLDNLARSAVAALVVTQIAVDGMLGGPDLALYRDLLEATDVPIVASGGVAGVDDLVALRDLRSRDGTRRLTGAIAGRAIYEGRLGLAEGLSACTP